MRTTLINAIAHSIAYDCTAEVDVDGDLFDALAELASCVDDYDHTTDANGDLDVWGQDDDGCSFRVILRAA